jgi:hypothetical protein
MVSRHKSLVLLVALLAFLGLAKAQDAEITFYSNGSLLMMSAPWTKHALFGGEIYDGTERVASLYPRRFLTLRVTPGSHVFSASYSKHPAKNSQLAVTVAAGETYFISAEAESRGLGVKGRLDLVPCQKARDSAGSIRPLEHKYIALTAKSKVVTTTSFPACN